jgi:hypothetical protein
MQRQEYKEVFAISQSAIKDFIKKPLKKWKQIYIDQEEQPQDDKFTFGSLVDTLTLEKNLFDKRFFIPRNDVEIPGDKVKFVVDAVFKEAKEINTHKELLNQHGNLPEPMYIPDYNDLLEYQDLILKYAKEIKLGGSTWKNSTIINTVREDGSRYFRVLGEAEGRIIISVADNFEAVECVEALTKSPESRSYFVQQEGETLLFQQEVYTEIETPYRKLPLKGALDIIRFKHDEKTVRVADLKTSEKPDQTIKSIRKDIIDYNYLTQASFYTYLLKFFLAT